MIPTLFVGEAVGRFCVLSEGRSPICKGVSLQGPSWAQFPVQVLHFEFEMLQAFRLPPFPGSMFRGVLGWALREVCDKDDYAYLFETTSDRDGQQDAQRPFVLLPPFQVRELRRGDRFRIALKLLGRGCEYLPQFVEASRVAGQHGLGGERAQFEIVRIVAHEGERDWVAYDRGMGWSRVHFPLPTALGAFAPALGQDVPEIELEFCTPTRLVFHGAPVVTPDFHIVLRALFRRIDGLLQHHCGRNLEVDFRGDVAAAAQVISLHQVGWVDWERKSNRQQRRHIMGGVVGRSLYRGPLAPHWVELLGAGQVIHLGKATTFGMGAYRLRIAR